MKRYLGTFNYQGENIVLWVHANSEGRAFALFITELAARLGRTRISVSNYFHSGKDNYLIEEKE